MSATTIDVLLVAEDAVAERRLRQDLGLYTRTRMELTRAESLDMAMATLANRTFDAALLDLALPECGGLKGLRRLRLAARAMPVIVLANCENETVALEAVREGAQDYLVKSRSDSRMLTRVVRYAIERKRIEEALRESEQRYRRLLASTTDYIYTVKVDNGVSQPARHGEACLAVTGYSREEYAEDPYLWYRMIHEEDRPAVDAQIHRLLSGESTPPLEHRILHKNGSIRWIRNTPVARCNDAGQITAYDGLIIDITERKRAELELLRANAGLMQANAELSRSEDALRLALTRLGASHEQLKATRLQLIQAEKLECIGTLAAGVAHEVKNPLQTILMGVHYLSGRANDDENLQLVIREMRDSIKRADSIVRELVTFAATNHPDKRPESINQLISLALDLMRYELTHCHVEVVLDLDSSLPVLLLDFNKLQQALINLFLNAVQAMPQGGTLTIRTWQRWARAGAGGEVALEVSDTGKGIPEEKLARIFDPFFTLKPIGEGTGLGLTVTRRIVELHGGVIEASNCEAGGARFVVRFPIEHQESYEKETNSDR
jgi:PAS domain S-box-containing protein